VCQFISYYGSLEFDYTRNVGFVRSYHIFHNSEFVAVWREIIGSDCERFFDDVSGRTGVSKRKNTVYCIV